MKRFIIISLLWATTLPLLACAWPATHNYYLFSPCENQEFRERMERLTEDNWKAYLGWTDNYFYFDADKAIATARQKKDTLMVSYLQQLQKYLDCADQKRREQWDYPTKEQLAKRTQTLKAVKAYAQGKLKTRLRSQHALLLMRCNMMLSRHAENVTFWNTTGSLMIESVYRDMMRNIYAGALHKTGSEEAATQIFAEQGDWESLMTIYYKRRSYAAIRQEYLRNPDSAVLPFLLKDFVNNAQEAVDGPDVLPGKLFVRNIQQKEAMQMCQLAAQAVKDGKSSSPCMWQSAKAWLEYLYGNRQQAAKDIVAAAGMAGTPRMKDNVRVLMLYITASQAPASADFDNYLADELEWLDSRQQQQQNDLFYSNALDRLVNQVLMGKYASRPIIATSLLKATNNWDYTAMLDTMKVSCLQQYINYASTPASKPLDKYLKARQKIDSNVLNDLMGTKYLRLCQWQQAVEWLKKVPLAFYNERGYAVYAANRSWTFEPWMKRQWLKQDMEYSDTKWQLKANPKIAFAQEMMAMEGELNVLSGLTQQQRCYDLAIRYAQAHFTGDCWFLMRDGKSVGDTLRVNETDLATKALDLLRKASQTTDFALKEKALFAMSYGELYTKKWYDEVWNDKTYETYRKPNSRSPQYKAFTALKAFEKQNATRTTRYVSRCDEYLQFCKANK
jgi:hypothetical protein